MEQYIISARKYRPSNFDNVVGQEHIGETLKNAIRSNHLAQAFLFSGPRGVGKTTCARILAKTINCMERTDKVEACDKCASCKSFNEGHSLNIYELDAASNNSVDDIRSLIDQVRFAPQVGSKKVYIIDEVHMLSTSAFNAFLKTLEEPPSHAIFILATTEKHKILPTILSRCQVFDFNRIEIEDMVRRLEDIASREDVKAENEALHLIALKSDGSLRDALSMFDQMVTYSGQNITYQTVVENLSILDSDYFFALTDHLVSGDVSSSLKLFDEILRKGFDGHHFVLGLAEHLRNLLVAQDHRTIELIAAGETIRERYGEQTKRVSSAFLIHGLDILSKTDIHYKGARNQRLLVELTLIKLAAGNQESTLSPRKEVQAVAPSVPNTPAKKKPEPSEIPSNEIKSENPEKDKDIEKREADIVPATGSDSEERVESRNVVSEPVVNSPEIKETDVVKAEKEVENPTRKTEVLKDIEKSVRSETSKNTKRYNPDIVKDTISIKDFTEPDSEYKKENTQATDTQLKKSEVTPENFQKAWNSLLERIDKSGKFNLHSALSRYTPEIQQEEIVVTYDNKAQVETINAERADILEYLRKELHNDSVALKLKISDKEYQRAYTPAEKLQKMIEKNPNIHKLKENLDLDFGI